MQYVCKPPRVNCEKIPENACTLTFFFFLFFVSQVAKKHKNFYSSHTFMMYTGLMGKIAEAKNAAASKMKHSGKIKQEYAAAFAGIVSHIPCMSFCLLITVLFSFSWMDGALLCHLKGWCLCMTQRRFEGFELSMYTSLNTSWFDINTFFIISPWCKEDKSLVHMEAMKIFLFYSR